MTLLETVSLGSLVALLAACEGGKPTPTSAPAPAVIVGCSTVKFEGLLWESTGCAAGVAGYDATLRTAGADGKPREANVHIECAQGCITKVTATPSVPASPGGTLSAKPDAGAAPSPAADPVVTCTWQPAAGTVTATLTGNNGVEITSAPGGKAAPADPAMRKMVPVKVTVPIAGLEVGNAWLFRGYAGSESAYLALAVRNTGMDYLCRLKAENYHWRTSAGAEAVDPSDNSSYRDVAYLHGSVGQSSGLFTDTCLGPGETGYFADIRVARDKTRIYSDVATIEFAFASTLPGTAAAGKMLARSYETGVCDRSAAIRFRFENPGSAPVRVREVLGGWLVAFDESGAPNDWSYLSTEDWVRLEPGASVAIATDTFLGSPGWTKAHVYGFFDGYPPSAQPPLAGPAAQLADEIVSLHRRLQRDWQRVAIERGKRER